MFVNAKFNAFNDHICPCLLMPNLTRLMIIFVFVCPYLYKREYTLIKPKPVQLTSFYLSLQSCSHCRIRLAIVQELCESRGGGPGLSVLTSLLVSVDVKLY